LVSITPDALTQREIVILSALSRGLTDREIAQRLFISVRTVQSHLAHIYEKLHVHNRTEAALFAVQHGLV
jgi:NarL family two-component system response regulator LiaR